MLDVATLGVIDYLIPGIEHLGDTGKGLMHIGQLKWQFYRATYTVPASDDPQALVAQRLSISRGV